MFNVFSDLTQVLRKEWPIEPVGSQILVSGVSGSWVTIDSNGNAELTSAAGGTQLAWPIWNESYRNGAVGEWTPDVTNAKRVSTIVGKLFATTDQFTGTPARGNLLFAGPVGKLAVATLGTNPAVAVCVNPSYTVTQFGTTFTVIDIQIL